MLNFIAYLMVGFKKRIVIIFLPGCDFQIYLFFHLGYTGDADKASWIKTVIGLDWAFNYKTQDVHQTLKIAAPKGVDIFLDSVGGAMHQTVLNHMNFNGRVVQLGNLAMYDAPGDIEMVPANDLVVGLKVILKCYGLTKNKRNFGKQWPQKVNSTQ